ncbi:hypothetical protein H4CHR_00467 [Variovorax sp. PBS-H4]|uniref:hypothetical protein n=1 Tax=Variovorax sp. PBS-H4 TaxID=434008 RepID=UPI00131690C4|nr:hypothetical protein [Variovorax sp. PBS-H4]VTU19846.1 hypothetical protein H4CHR_00467 [Variovorax sp. PBS-H4]
MINLLLYRKLPFNADKDLKPWCQSWLRAAMVKRERRDFVNVIRARDISFE